MTDNGIGIEAWREIGNDLLDAQAAAMLTAGTTRPHGRAYYEAWRAETASRRLSPEIVADAMWFASEWEPVRRSYAAHIEIEVTLHKMRRRATASLTTKQVIAAVTVLGWRADKMAFVKQVIHGGDKRGTITVSGEHHDVEDKDSGIGYAEVRGLPTLNEAKANRRYVVNLTKPVQQKTIKRQGNRDCEQWAFTYQEWRKVNAYRFTAPDGQTFDIFGSPDTLGYQGTRGTTAVVHRPSSWIKPRCTANRARSPYSWTTSDAVLDNRQEPAELAPRVTAPQITPDGRRSVVGSARPISVHV